MESGKDSEREDILDTEWTETRAEELVRIAKAGNFLYSSQLGSTISHRGALPIQ